MIVIISGCGVWIQEFKVSLGCIARPCLPPPPNKNNKKEKIYIFTISKFKGFIGNISKENKTDRAGGITK